MPLGPDPATQTDEFSDAELVVLALNRPDSFIHILRRFEKPLSRYVRRILGPHAAAMEDVLQDAFLKAYVNLNDFDRSQPLSPWLYRIAHNEAISLLRKRKSLANVFSAVDSELLIERIACAPENDAPALKDLHDARVGEELTRLDQRYRDVLALRFLEDKSYRDIGEILHLPPGTVATLIRRGLRRLRSALELGGVTMEEIEK